jgi:predicted  nucleic acid-binding Zn-ribbon protein
LEEQTQNIDYSISSTEKEVQSWKEKSKRAKEQIKKQKKINMKKKLNPDPEHLKIGFSNLKEYIEVVGQSENTENMNTQNLKNDNEFNQEFEHKLNLTLKTILLY